MTPPLPQETPEQERARLDSIDKLVDAYVRGSMRDTVNICRESIGLEPMQTKHTPGPWTWREDGCELRGIYTREDGSQCPDQVLSIDLPEFIEPGNKALIAAAPDLLEACACALDLMERYVQGAEGAHAQLRAAIAKALTDAS